MAALYAAIKIVDKKITQVNINEIFKAVNMVNFAVYN